MANDNTIQQDEQQPEAGQAEPNAAALQQDSETDDQQQDSGDEPDPRNAEAAKHRHRAKAAEDGLAVARTLMDDQGQQIASLQRQVVDAHIAHAFADPSDFHRDVDFADLMDDQTGNIDLAKVDAAAQKVLADHPHYRRNAYAPSAVPASVVTTNTPPTHVPGGGKPSWSDVLNEGKKLQ